MNKIIVHPGKAHLDEYAACAILIAHDALWCDVTAEEVAKDWTVERRTPAPEELEAPDASVFIVDVGGIYDPRRGLYDHHQLARGSRDSAMTLVAASLGLPNGASLAPYEPAKPGESLTFPTDSFAEILDKLFPWFRKRAEVDSCGPFAAAKSSGTDWATVSPFMGPFEDIVLKVFETDPMKAVLPLAETIVSKVRAFGKVKTAVKTDKPWWGDGDFTITDFTAADPKLAEEVSDAIVPEKGVAVFHDNRGSGLTLLRLGDDPRIDFTKVKGDPEVAFAHAGGFIAKTRGKDLGKAWDLIETAYAEGGAK